MRTPCPNAARNPKRSWTHRCTKMRSWVDRKLASQSYGQLITVTNETMKARGERASTDAR